MLSVKLGGIYCPIKVWDTKGMKLDNCEIVKINSSYYLWIEELFPTF